MLKAKVCSLIIRPWWFIKDLALTCVALIFIIVMLLVTVIQHILVIFPAAVFLFGFYKTTWR